MAIRTRSLDVLALAEPQPLPDPPLSSSLTGSERTVLFACLSAALIAYLFPHPATKYLLGGGLALLFIAVSVRHFYIGLALFAFCLPLQVLLPHGSFFIRGLNVQTLFVIGFCVLSMMTASNEKAGIATAGGKNVLTKPLAGLMTVMLLSAVHSSLATSLSFGDLFMNIKNQFIYAVFAFLAFKRVREDHEKVFVLLFILVVTTLTAADSTRSVIAAGVERNRAVSLISGQPNLWAGYLAMYAFFFIAAFLYYPMSKITRLITFGALAIVMIDLLFTQSRGAWMAFGFTAVFVSGMKARRMLVLLILLGGALYWWTPSFAVDRFASGFKDEYDPALLMKNDVEVEEAATRIVQWRSFPTMFGQYGLLGAGYGRYGEMYQRGGYDVRPKSAHAAIIDVGIEEGVAGLFFYFWIFLAVYRRGSAVLKQAESPVSRVIALGLVAATLCVVILDLSGNRSRDAEVMVFYWMIAGMTMNIPLKSDAPGGTPGAPPPQAAPQPGSAYSRRRAVRA